MGDEASQERERSLAAPIIFLIVAGFQFAYYCLDHVKKGACYLGRPEVFKITVTIGIISWLMISARVCRFVRRAYSKQIKK